MLLLLARLWYIVACSVCAGLHTAAVVIRTTIVMIVIVMTVLAAGHLALLCHGRSATGDRTARQSRRPRDLGSLMQHVAATVGAEAANFRWLNITTASGSCVAANLRFSDGARR